MNFHTNLCKLTNATIQINSIIPKGITLRKVVTHAYAQLIEVSYNISQTITPSTIRSIALCRITFYSTQFMKKIFVKQL